MSTSRVIGTARQESGTGVVRLEDRFDTDPEDLWSALTDPDRLKRWLGEVDGDLREGGEFRAHFFASGWEGTCRVEVCDAPRHAVIHTSTPDQPDGRFDIMLTPEGEGTLLVVEDSGVPLDQVASYGAGDQIHVEDLRSYLSGGEPCDARARWQELQPGWVELCQSAGLG